VGVASYFNVIHLPQLPLLVHLTMEEMKALEARFLDVSPPLEFSTREPQIASLSSCYSSASHIERADASWKGKSADTMQATDAEGQFWEAEDIGSNKLPPRPQLFSGGKQQLQRCCDGKRYPANVN
jgi:hypothetical protein